MHVSEGLVHWALHPPVELTRVACLYHLQSTLISCVALGKLSHQCVSLSKQKAEGCLLKEHSAVDHGSHVMEGKATVLSPVPRGESETAGNRARQEGLVQKPVAADSKTGPSSLLITASLAWRVCSPSLRTLHSQGMRLSHSEGLRMQPTSQASVR